MPSTAMGTGTEHLLNRRHRLGATLTPLDPNAEFPRTGVAIVACTDAGPAAGTMSGLRPGDAHVIRDAGGCVTDDTLRPLRLGQLRGATTEIVLVHHEDRAVVTDPDADPHGCPARIRQSKEPPHSDVVRGFVHTRGGAPREIRPPMRAEYR
ncbi:hypothetical protein AB0M29_29775 [Streptomyces sp. NPDC051976]|uniref:hypothetical protein n=1 Tax=Streptomyces sp. NPDC051976 TaxID=3154947 RepID=UPI00343ED56F